MGISIHLAISKSVTREEWKSVYEESLKLVEAFPLAEKRKIKIDDIEVVCLVKSEEHEENYGWNDEEVRVGWDAVGDYTHMITAEDYYLPRDLVDDNEYEEECEDALYGVLPAYLNYSWEDPEFLHIYDIWGAKTQGEPYHMYLLAIACLIEARLGNKAFVYGNITRGQCIRAVEMANAVLEKPIEVPDRCDADKLYERVKTLPISEVEKMTVYVRFYMGKHNAEFGNYLRKHFSKDICDQYWKKKLGQYEITQSGFEDAFSDYLLWGFDLECIVKFINFENKDGNLMYDKFVEKVMDAKLHLKDKDCSDPLKIDEDESRPYGVSTLFAGILFGHEKSKKIDRYIPIVEVRAALNNALAEKCDVNAIIDEYLKKEKEQTKIHISSETSEEELHNAYEQDASEVFRQVIDMKKKQFEKEWKEYDIAEYEHLKFYEKGDSINPNIMKSVGKFFAFYCSVLGEEKYKALLSEAPDKRCRWLAEQNRYILIRDQDWEKIFKDIKETKNSFARYYPMIRVCITSREISHMIEAIIINDELYEYCDTLAEKYGKEE